MTIQGLFRAALVGAALAGCGATPLPRDLFSIDVAGADYPLMLSRAPAGQGGRKIHAESGTHAAASSQTYSAGNSTITVTQTESSRSELSASVKLAAQVQRADRWVQFDGAVFNASDFSTYGASSSDRTLIVDATSHK